MAEEYGSPMGTEAPGTVRAERPRAKEASVAERRKALQALDARSSGEARRSNVSGRGSSQGSGGAKESGKSLSAFDAARTIKDKKARDNKAIDDMS